MQDFIKKHDLLNKLFAVLTAIVLWAIVINIKNPIISKSYHDILVEITSSQLIEETFDLVVVSQQFPVVDVKLRGVRDNFVQLNTSNIYVTADLSQIKEAGEYEISYNVKTPYSDMEVVSLYPEKLTVVIDQIITREIPVLIDVVGTPVASYSYKEVESRSSIYISGPSNEVLEIESANISVDITNLSQDILNDFNVVLKDYNGEVVNSENIAQTDTTIEVFMPVYQTATIPLELDLIYGTVVSSKKIDGYFLDTKSVSIIGYPKDVNAIRSINIGEIYIDDTQYGKEKFTFALPVLDDVQYVSHTPTVISATINFTDYTHAIFNVDNFIFDESMIDSNMEFLTKDLDITIFGDEFELSTIELDDITIEIFLDRELYSYEDEFGNNIEGYYPLDVGLHFFDAIININSTFEFDILDEYVVSIQVLEEE